MYEEEIDLRVYIDTLLRRRRLIITLALGMALVAMIVSFMLPPTYEAQAALSVAPRRSNITLTEDFTLSEEEINQLDMNQRGEALTEIARSLKVAQAVMETHPNLDGEAATANSMVNKIEVSMKNDLLVITASADTPEKAAALATAWAEATQNQINAVYTFNTEIIAEIQSEMGEAWEEYRTAQQALETFLSESDISALESRIKIVETLLKEYEQASAESAAARYTERLSAQQNELNKLYNQKINIQQQLTDARTLSAQLSQTEDVITDTWGTALAFINLQANAYGGSPGSMLQFDLTGNAPPLTASTVELVITSLESKMIEVEKQIATLSDQLGEVETEASPLMKENALQTQVEELTEDLSTLEAQLEAQEAQQTQLTEARNVAWTTYTSLSNKQREIKVQESVAASEARLAFEALPPDNPSGPDKKLNTAVAGALGLMLGVFGAFMIEYLVPEPNHETKRDVISRWLLAEAPGLPNFEPDQRHDTTVSRKTEEPTGTDDL